MSKVLARNSKCSWKKTNRIHKGKNKVVFFCCQTLHNLFSPWQQQDIKIFMQHSLMQGTRNSHFIFSDASRPLIQNAEKKMTLWVKVCSKVSISTCSLKNVNLPRFCSEMTPSGPSNHRAVGCIKKMHFPSRGQTGSTSEPYLSRNRVQSATEVMLREEQGVEEEHHKSRNLGWKLLRLKPVVQLLESRRFAFTSKLGWMAFALLQKEHGVSGKKIAIHRAGCCWAEESRTLNREAQE